MALDTATTLTAALVLHALAPDQAVAERAKQLAEQAIGSLTADEHRHCILQAARITAAARRGRIK